MNDNDICELCDDAGQIDTREGKTVGCPACIERELNRKIADLNEALADKRRLTRELDVAMHGEEGAAKQASLCDLIEPAKKLRAEVGRLTDVAIDYVTKLGKAQGRLDVEQQMVESLRRSLAEATAWTDDDKPLPEDEQIEAAFPTRTGRHDLYAEAMRMVGAKRSKGALVALVNWLLVQGEEAERLRKEINTPEIVDFVKAVQLEAAHQRERWGTEHDGGKTVADWYWLIGYLAGKALFNLLANNQEKGLHHIITTAAACANWHLHATGVNTQMRPGIAPPDGEPTA